MTHTRSETGCPFASPHGGQLRFVNLHATAHECVRSGELCCHAGSSQYDRLLIGELQSVLQEHGAAEEGDDEFTLYRKRMQVSGTASDCVQKCALRCAVMCESNCMASTVSFSKGYCTRLTRWRAFRSSATSTDQTRWATPARATTDDSSRSGKACTMPN